MSRVNMRNRRYRRCKRNKLKRIRFSVSASIVLMSGTIALIIATNTQGMNKEIETKESITKSTEVVYISSEELNSNYLNNSDTIYAEESINTKSSIQTDTIKSEIDEDHENDRKIRAVIDNDEQWKTGYVTTTLNIRKEPNTSSEILDRLKFQDQIKYKKFNDEWYIIKYNKDEFAYVFSEYISDESIDYTSYLVSSSGFKSFMPYTSITSKTSSAYKIQYQFAYTGTYGIRQVNGRYCIAVGSGANASNGSYVDLILENGTIIECIVSDQKADCDTGSDNLTTYSNGCVSEFLVDYTQLISAVKISGDISSCKEEWDSPVCEIRVYDKSVLN